MKTLQFLLRTALIAMFSTVVASSAFSGAVVTGGGNVPSTQTDVSGGSYTNPSGQSTTGSQSGDSASVSVSGDFSVQPVDSSSIVISIQTQLALTGISPGTYQTFSSIDGYFSSSLEGFSTAYVAEYQNVVQVFSADLSTLIPGSSAFAGGVFPSDFAPLSLMNHITSAGTSMPFSLSGGDYVLYIASTIDIEGVQPGETINIDLPNGGNLGPSAPVPAPSSLALLGMGIVSAAGFWSRRRNNAETKIAS